MVELGTYKNVFDDPGEFSKLQDAILGAVQDFSEYRKGNLTLGEIMYVMECILDTLRNSSEKDAAATSVAKGLNEPPTFTALVSVCSRLVERLVKAGLLNAQDEAFILHGENKD